MWALMTLDNLAAHCTEDTKHIHRESHAFLCYLSKDATESTQMIDAGCVRSARCSMGRVLDEWLMTEDSMTKWEGKMTVSEQRALISDLASEANSKALNNDAMCLGCFARAGGLMTRTKSDIDSLTKPQGVISRISMLEICNPKNFHAEVFRELASPADVINPENDSGNDDIHEEDHDAILNDAELAIEDDSHEFQSESTEILEGTEVIESNDDLDIMQTCNACL